MFGFVVANSKILSDEEKSRYKAVYCGLCESLKKRHGQAGRITLNYDMTFLILVLSSLYDHEECPGCGRCFVHPVKKHDYVSSPISDYAADMTVALAYLNTLDNWNDDHNIMSLALSKVLKKKFEKVADSYPRQCGAMLSCIEELAKLEERRDPDPDTGARLFGELMAELFVRDEDRWAPALRQIGMNLGEFIYLMDAAVDLEKDMKKGRYNPLTALKEAGRDDEFFRGLLTVIIGNCSMEFEKLPLVDDAALMRNILYSGVWTRYEMQKAAKSRKKEINANDV